MFLLDTNVLSELRKVRANKADPHVTAWAGTVQPGSLYLSVIVIEELEIATLLVERRDPAQGRSCAPGWTGTYCLRSPNVSCKVDLAVVRPSAALHVPSPRSTRDALIAATALVHGLIVVTRNVNVFDTTGAPFLNPWDT